MTRDEALTFIAAILSTLSECSGYATCTTLYLGLVQKGVSGEDYQAIQTTMVACGYVSIENSQMVLTAYGWDTAAEINKVLTRH